ncbi:MAG TPA: hypothetical protein GX707_06125 [Epulopiscium sp.]|nr:hypothetical protein [Candidatus Epulonipiscium sp.]
MDCEKYSEWISLYIDGELEDKDCTILENHISNCNSCREEVDILQEITKSIKGLEAIEPPNGFHEALMGRIKSEYEYNQQKVIALPTKYNKWYRNLKIASAVAAVFIFSTVLLNPPKTKSSQEALPAAEDNMMKSRMMDVPAESTDEVEVQGTVFAMEEISLEGNLQTWIIETKKYKEYKEAIWRMGKEMESEAIVIEELGSEALNTQSITMEITLSDDEKAEFETIIRAVDKTANIIIQEEIEAKKEQEAKTEQENGSKMTLVIIINQIN